MTFDGKPWQWSAPPRCLLLLAHFASRRGSGSARNALATMLWPDDIDADARSNLRRHIHRLQRALPAVDGVSWIETKGRTVAWNEGAPAWFDVRAFEDALADPAHHARALEFYRGDLLNGFYDEQLLADRERLRASYLDLLLRLCRDARHERDFATAVTRAEALLAADEWREDAVRELLAAKYEAGDRSGALAAYERFARRLHDDFASAPMAETTALRDAIRAGLQLSEQFGQPAEIDVRENARRSRKLPFTGRGDELERLRAAWSRAARKSGSVAFISGEAGIGKTRLSSEIASVVREQGGHVLIGVTSNPEAQAYQAIVTALRASLSMLAGIAVDAGWLASVATVLPEVRSLHPSLTVEELPIDSARKQLFEGIARVFESLGKLRPLCVILEDVHWAGPGTLAMIESLARRVGTLPVLLIVTFRSDDTTDAAAVSALRAKLVQERRAMALPLARLESQDVRGIVRTAVGEESGDGVLAVEIARLSEGNPLFVAQLLENFLETHTIPSDAAALQTVGDAIGARTRRLDGRVRAVAEVAATIGHHFRADVVAGTGGWTENEVLDALGELMDRALVRESGSGALEYVFTHALIAGAFYLGSAHDQRIARHRRVAQLIDRNHGGDVAVLSAVAAHWELAGDEERAARAYLEAARASIGLYARDEAIGQARRVVELAADPSQRLEALLLISSAQRGHADPADWKITLDALEAQTSTLGIEQRFAYLWECESYARQIGDDDAARVAIDAMLALTSRDLPHHRGAVLTVLGKLQIAGSNLLAALTTLREAESACRRSGDRANLAMASDSLVEILVRLGHGEEARRVVADMYREADADADATPSMRRRLLNGEIAVALATEDMDLAIRAGSDLLDVARVLGDAYAEVHALQILAYGGQYRSSVSTVRDRLRVAFELSQRVGARDNVAAMWTNAASFERYLGRARETLALTQRSLAQLDERDVTSRAYAMLERSHAYAMLGDMAAARSEAAGALERALAIGERRMIASAKMALGQALWQSGDAIAALIPMRQAVEMWRMDRVVAPLCNDLCAYAVALLDAGQADVATAVAAELDALCAEHPGKQWYPSRSHWALARVARANGDEAQARYQLELGRAALDRELTRLGDPQAAASYAALAFHRELLAGLASTVQELA